MQAKRAHPLGSSAAALIHVNTWHAHKVQSKKLHKTFKVRNMDPNSLGYVPWPKGQRLMQKLEPLEEAARKRLAEQLEGYEWRPSATVPAPAHKIQRQRGPFRTIANNCLDGPSQKFPLYHYQEGSHVVYASKYKLNVAMRNMLHSMTSSVDPGRATFRYCRYLYGRLRGDTLFQPRNEKLLITMRNKAFRYLAEFDTSMYSSEEIADIVEETVIAAWVPSARQCFRMAKCKQAAASLAVAAYNNELG